MTAGSEPIRIRSARAGDLDAIARLFVQLRDHHRQLQPTNPRYEVAADRWRDIARETLEDPGMQISVAAQDDLVLAFMKIHFETKPWGLSCEVDTMVVDDKWRGRGIGTQLLEEAEEIARRHGATGIRVDVLIPNYDGREFYERAGYEAFAVRYGKPVRD